MSPNGSATRSLPPELPAAKLSSSFSSWSACCRVFMRSSHLNIFRSSRSHCHRDDPALLRPRVNVFLSRNWFPILKPFLVSNSSITPEFHRGFFWYNAVGEEHPQPVELLLNRLPDITMTLRRQSCSGCWGRMMHMDGTDKKKVSGQNGSSISSSSVLLPDIFLFMACVTVVCRLSITTYISVLCLAVGSHARLKRHSRRESPRREQQKCGKILDSLLGRVSPAR